MPPVQGGKESDRTVAHLCKFLALNQARPQGQRWGQALQGWDAGLLIETQHATVAWGVQIEGANLRPLLLKPGVGAGPAVAQALGVSTKAAKIRWTVAGLLVRISPRPATKRAKSRTR